MIEMRNNVIALLEAEAQEPGTALADWKILKSRRNLTDRCILVEFLRETTIAEDGDTCTVEGRLQCTVLRQVDTKGAAMAWEDAGDEAERAARAMRATILSEPTLAGLTRWSHETGFDGDKLYGATMPEWGEREAVRMVLKALYVYRAGEIISI